MKARYSDSPAVAVAPRPLAARWKVTAPGAIGCLLCSASSLAWLGACDRGASDRSPAATSPGIPASYPLPVPTQATPAAESCQAATVATTPGAAVTFKDFVTYMRTELDFDVGERRVVTSDRTRVTCETCAGRDIAVQPHSSATITGKVLADGTIEASVVTLAERPQGRVLGPIQGVDAARRTVTVLGYPIELTRCTRVMDSTQGGDAPRTVRFEDLRIGDSVEIPTREPPPARNELRWVITPAVSVRRVPDLLGVEIDEIEIDPIPGDRSAFFAGDNLVRLTAATRFSDHGTASTATAFWDDVLGSRWYWWKVSVRGRHDGSAIVAAEVDWYAF